MDGCDIKKRILSTKFLPDISIDGDQIDKNELAREIQYHPAKDFHAAMQQAAQALVIRHLLLRECKAAGINANDDEETAFNELIKQHTHITPPSDDDCFTIISKISEPLPLQH